MSGKFTIDSNFNVFDDWGQFAGTITPAGGDELGFVYLILMLIVLAIFATYFLLRLLISGVIALINREWIKGIIYLSPFWMSAIIMLTATSYNNIVQSRIENIAQGVDYHLIRSTTGPDGVNYQYRIYNGTDTQIRILDMWGYERDINPKETKTVEIFDSFTIVNSCPKLEIFDDGRYKYSTINMCPAQ